MRHRFGNLPRTSRNGFYPNPKLAVSPEPVTTAAACNREYAGDPILSNGLKPWKRFMTRNGGGSRETGLIVPILWGPVSPTGTLLGKNLVASDSLHWTRHGGEMFQNFSS